ncbi:hypothetical protein B0H15DRAFT_775415 [Mycena belliarum]|uniref:RNase III domain-containing protein n=1 Tax=Mycena belliarum TaxID=1033014 RepID=A0AAD6UDS1_9AGAR|nr:hypothetical protein B0H15DRAFT_775415 [Mycena belliae]
MIKVWKKKWREHLEHDAGPENLGGPDSSLPSSRSESVPPDNFQAAVPPALSGSKRSQTQASLDSDSTPPVKKSRKDAASLHSIVLEPDSASCSPNELVVMYDQVHEVPETQLFHRLHSLDPSESILRRHFNDARRVGAEVGMCAADLIWRRALKNIRVPSSPYSGEEEEEEEEEDGPLKILNETKAEIWDAVQNWAFTMPNLDPNSRGFNVTPKFLRLVQILKSCEHYGEDFRGIIFVNRRAVAFAILDLIPMLGEHIGFVRAHAITGQGTLSFTSQQDVFRRFNMGIHNLLISTKSAEDLDLPTAVVVIRFDLFVGDVSYAFIRSRTAGKLSHLVHMMGQKNDSHRHILLSNSVLQHPDMMRWNNILQRCPTSAAPPRPLLVSRYSEHSDSEEDEASELCIEDPIAGGRIYPKEAAAVVYRLASTTCISPFPTPIFQFTSPSSASTTSPLYICTVSLPGTPAHNVAGMPCSSMAHARRSACYQVCLTLAEVGLLDSEAFLVPSRRSKGHAAERIVRPQDSSGVYYAGVQVYPRKAPDFWSNSTGDVGLLYPTVIVVQQSNQAAHAPILLLTRHRMSKFPSFKLFFSGSPVVIDTYRGAPFKLDDEKTTSLHLYTLRLCRAVANKAFICPLQDMPYFLAPLPAQWSVPDGLGRWELLNVVDHIPWEAVALGALSWFVPLKYGRAEEVAQDIEDAVIQDRATELTRRYDVLRVRPDLSPLSHPEDSPREAKFDTLLDYCKTVRKNFEGLKDEGQALIEISTVLQANSRLDPASRSAPLVGPPPPRYLIPELCLKFTVPASTFRTALLFPSITRRLDSFLLVKELNARFFNHQISEALLDMAITARSTRTEYDYERLELLGDSFLKYLSSIYVFVNEPSNKEGALHTARQHLVSNNTLFRSFDSAGLPSYVQSKPFSSKFWQPPNFRTTEEPQTKLAEINRHRKESEQRLGDKVIADVAEAILGAAYLSGGSDTALMAAKAMNIPFPNIEKWSDFDRKLLIPPSTITAELRPGGLHAVEDIINHKFKHPHILAQALTHASVSAAERVSYERLEFIGDAILDFLVIRYIFDRDSKLSPGGLTLLKGAMVSNSALAAVCISSGLHKHLLLAARLSDSVAEYMEQLKVKQAEEYELARVENRSPGQYWNELEAPKVLSDVVESVIGAMYISDNFTPVGVEAFFEAVLKPFYDKHITLKTVAHHPTKILYELIQAQRCQKFRFLKEKRGNETCCHILLHDVILASGEGPSISLAARSASSCALDALQGDAEFLRICDCPKHDEGKGRGKGFDEILSGLEE